MITVGIIGLEDGITAIVVIGRSEDRTRVIGDEIV